MKRDLTHRELIDDYLKSSGLDGTFVAEYTNGAIERGTRIAEILEKSIPLRGSKVLDLGCGEGGVAIALALLGGDVTAMDISPGRIERVLVWAAERGVALNGVAGDALATGLPDGQWDIVICNDLMEHVSNGQMLADEINRLLRPGGYLYLNTTNRLSIFEFLSDSHYNLFGFSALPRSLAKTYVVRIRKRTKEYTLGAIPTPGYVEKLFEKTRISLYPIHSQDIRNRILNPELISSRSIRWTVSMACKLGFFRLLLKLADSSLSHTIGGEVTAVGVKR